MRIPIPVERISPISKEDFYSRYVNKSRPVVFTGLAAEWQAPGLWNANYIADYSGNAVTVNTVPFKNGRLDMDAQSGCTIERIALKDAIQSTIENSVEDDKRAIVSSMADFPAEIQQQCPPFAYCADGGFLRANVLIGPTGTVTPLHQDLFENLYTTVTGCKRIILFAPSAPVYRNSLFSKLPNFAQTNPEQPDYVRFPKFEQAQAYTVDLKPGETLYIPALWWHHLRNMEPTIAVSFWWGHSWRLIPAWMGATYKKLASK